MTRKTVSKVLELKGFTREQLEAEVTRSRGLLRREEEKLASLELQVREAEAELAAKVRMGAMKVHEHEVFSTYLRHLGRQVKQQKEAVAASAAEVARREQALLEAFKEEKLVGKLHDRILHAETKAADKAQQKESDYSYLARRTGK